MWPSGDGAIAPIRIPVGSSKATVVTLARLPPVSTSSGDALVIDKAVGVTLVIVGPAATVTTATRLSATLLPTVPEKSGFAPFTKLTGGAAVLLAVGVAVVGVGLAPFTKLTDAAAALLAVGVAAVGVGLAPLTTVSTDIMVGIAPPERAGAASSISETSSELGGALGIAILGSIGTAMYRSRMAAALPAAVPAQATRAALSTIGGAAAVAAQLPDPFRLEVLRIARHAFMQAFALVSGISAAIALATAIVALVLLRRVHQSGTDESSSGRSQ